MTDTRTTDPRAISLLQETPKLSRRVRMRFDKVRGGHVLMLPETAVLLGDTSAEILALCDGEKTVSEIIATLQERYPESDLGGDVLEFLEEAHEQRWIKWHTRT